VFATPKMRPRCLVGECFVIAAINLTRIRNVLYLARLFCRSNVVRHAAAWMAHSLLLVGEMLRPPPGQSRCHGRCCRDP